MKIIIKPKKITHKNFKKFGDLISTRKAKPIKINNGYAKRFDNLCRINTSLKKGNTSMSIFAAKKRKFPMNIKMMEKHPLGSQAFVPMSETKFFVFVVFPITEKSRSHLLKIFFAFSSFPEFSINNILS